MHFTKKLIWHSIHLCLLHITRGPCEGLDSRRKKRDSWSAPKQTRTWKNACSRFKMAIFECLHACRNKWSCKHQHFSVFCEQTWKILVSNIFGYIHAYNICYNAVKTQIVPSLRDLSKKFSLLGIFKPHFEDLCAVARSVLPKTFTQPRPHLEKWKKIYVLIGIYLRRFWLTIGNRDWHPKTARISVVFSRVFGNSCLLGLYQIFFNLS
jgi:hypothetical protein